jgi:hypothetical protein
MSHTGSMDPVFAAAAEAAADTLFGGLVNSRELVAKMGPDSSSVHMTQALTSSRPKRKRTKAQRERRQAQVGLASNVVGIGAGAAALAQASNRMRQVRRDGPNATPGPIAEQALKVKPTRAPTILRLANLASSPKAIAIGAGSALGLQAANVGGDLVANRVLAREAKKKEDVGKGLGEMARNAGKQIKVYRMKHPSKGQQAAARQKTNDTANKYARRGAGTLLGAGAAAGVGAGYAFGAAPPGEAVPTRQELAQPIQARKEQVIGKADAYEVVWSGEFSKRDMDKQQVFGWANVSEIDGKPVLDRQGDYVPVDEMEKSAYDYVINSRKGGDMHKRVKKGLTTNFGDEPLHTSDMIESMVVTPEKLEKLGVPADVAKSVPVGWWVGFQVNDPEQWAMVKSGERTGFSIHGKGRRVHAEPIAKSTELWSDAKMRRRKKAQSHISMLGAGIGIGALGVKGGATVSRRVLPKVKLPGHEAPISTRQGVKVARKLDSYNTGLLTAGAGVGGIGGINFANIQGQESRKRAPRKVIIQQVQAPKEVTSKSASSPSNRLYDPLPGFDPEKKRQDRARNTTAATAAGAVGVGALAAREARPEGAVAAGYVRDRVRIVRNARSAAAEGERAVARARQQKKRKPAYVPPRQTPRQIVGQEAGRAREALSEVAGAARAAVEDAKIANPGTGLRRAVRAGTSIRQVRAGGKGALAAGLAGAAIAGNQDRKKRAKPYRAGEWYRR